MISIFPESKIDPFQILYHLGDWMLFLNEKNFSYWSWKNLIFCWNSYSPQIDRLIEWKFRVSNLLSYLISISWKCSHVTGAWNEYKDIVNTFHLCRTQTYWKFSPIIKWHHINIICERFLWPLAIFYNLSSNLMQRSISSRLI